MSDPLRFLMGEFEATFPADRMYAKNHMWAQAVADQRWRFGFSAYAVRLLQDVYFLDWTLDAGTAVRRQALIGSIESKKAESDLFAPIDGTLQLWNEQLLDDPSGINVSPYADGWLFEMFGEGAELLEPAQYVAFLEDVWEVTQRTIKGQLN